MITQTEKECNNLHNPSDMQRVSGSHRTTNPWSMIRDYHNRGLSVIPCEMGTKKPVVPWKKYQTTRPNDVELRTWEKKYPKCNVAVICGAISGMIVLDIDSEEGYRWIKENGHAIPPTPRVESSPGKGHFYFQHPGFPVKNMIRKLPGIDIKGDGGYVVAPPSIHPSGSKYCWVPGYSPADVGLAPCPPWLLDLIKPSEGTPDLTTKGPVHYTSLLDPEHVVTNGMRNKTLASVAGLMRSHGEEVSEILETLMGINKRRCKPSLPWREVAEIARSVSKYPPGSNKNKEVTNIAGGVSLTDWGNAQRLVNLNGPDFRYCYLWKSFLVWDGKRWTKDLSGEIDRLSKETIKSMLVEASKIDDEKERQSFIRHILKTQKEERRKAMIACARSEPGISIQPEEMDTDRWLLNCQNGTIELRSGQLREHRREDLITKIIPVAYDPSASCPAWHMFLDRILANNDGLKRYLQKVVGYSLTGSVREQCLFFLHGSGANGKSTFLNVIRKTLGDYARHTPSETFMVKRGDSIPADIADLKGARLVTAAEVEDGRRFAESLLKQLTGGDRIKARFLHSNFFEYDPEYKIFLAANHKPRISGTDKAIWRRFRLIPFTVAIPKEEQDRDLQQKLESELPGILAWAVKGCQMWQAEGLGLPAEVKQATQSYRQEMDILGKFIANCCIQKPDIKTPMKFLYQEYVRWCEDAGERPLSKNEFAKELTVRGFEPATGKGNIALRCGIGLLEG